MPARKKKISKPIPCAEIPPGDTRLGWTARYEFLESVAAEVKKKRGTKVELDAIDEVIFFLKSGGYVRIASCQ